ncbi:MAG TPA: glycoside hydrolase family 88 protein [Steroidobacteraceae bacterium]|nr:glycoside hydrolase family 88 protein [Steroidobacteraceae bacterium]
MRRRGGSWWAGAWLAGSLALAQLAHPAEHLDIGLSSHGARIEGMRLEGRSVSAPTVLVIGGLSGADASVAAARAALEQLQSRPPRERPFNLLVIPLANPDAAALQFPPTGIAYREHPEAHALWRWIGIHAPDLVLIGSSQDAGLAAALSQQPVAEVGRIPARVGIEPATIAHLGAADLVPSEAHREILRRQSRSPLQLARELAVYYGHDFTAPIYINAIALIAQLRLGDVAEVKRLAEPYLNGTRDSLAHPNALSIAGHTLFTALARRTGDPRAKARVVAAAGLGFEADGSLKEAMPYNGQFSDSLFMGTAILADAGALTGERRYFDMAARHVAFMQRLVLRPDGLYRHQPETDAAWGRGNAFPALGLAWALGEFPHDHPQYGWLLHQYQSLMAVLLRFQNEDGMWPNVIDHPGSYGEYSATAMIAWAMLRGTEQGWLPRRDYRPAVERAWRGILARTGPEGHLVDVCESTAGMSSLQDYLDRAAILGPDPRGGAMALLLATELAGLK